MYKIPLAIECERVEIVPARVRQAVETVLREAGLRQASVSVAIVDDPTIHDLNRRFLQHDYATDVLSFLLDHDDDSLDGEVIVSADTAADTAARLGCPAEDELLLYVVHGTLHLAGYDDLEPKPRAIMRRREREVLAQLGIEPRSDASE
jgi:probable rRNA maturation factor